MPTPALGGGWTETGVRRNPTRESPGELMNALARSAPRRGSFRVFFVGARTAALMGWRASTIDVDLYSDIAAIFPDVQGLKERLQLDIEFARPEDLVPPLAGTGHRHVMIETIGKVSFYHYDPYAQLLSKVIRGFSRDMQDPRSFIASGMVDPARSRSLVSDIPDAAYAKYPARARGAVLDAVEGFLAETDP